jgi:hypothetical protein
VAVFDDKRRLTMSPVFRRAALARQPAPTLYGFANFDSGADLSKFAVTPGGVNLMTSASALFYGADIKFSNGLLYSTGGSVVEPESQTLVGRFKMGVPGPAVLTPDPGTGRLYALVGGNGYPFFLEAFDLNTFLLLGSVPVSAIASEPLSSLPSSLVRWGTNGLAFRVNNRVFLVQTSLVPSADPILTPTPIPTATPTATPTPTPDDLKIVTLTTNDLVYDAHTQRLYASLPASAANGNSIASIDPATGTASSPIAVGNEPSKLGVSDDGQFLYALLNQTAIRRFALATQTPGLQINLGTHSTYGQYLATDFAVMPGNAHALAVARKFGNFFGPKHGGVAIFDDDVQRTFTTQPAESDSDGIEFSNSGKVLYGYDSTTIVPNNMRKMAVGQCGVSIYNVTDPLGYYFDTGFKYEGG